MLSFVVDFLASYLLLLLLFVLSCCILLYYFCISTGLPRNYLNELLKNIFFNLSRKGELNLKLQQIKKIGLIRLSLEGNLFCLLFR